MPVLHVADIAAYQGKISLVALREAGFGAINVKVSHGVTLQSVHPAAAKYVREAREQGMKLSSFHWLIGGVSGVAQADYAYRSMALFGLNVPGTVHVVDVEESGVTAGVYRDYCVRMRQLLGRPIVTYTGDWYATAPGREWLRASEESPWLWAPPNVGYLSSYPGDDSPLWDAGYGGWGRLSVMQYRVSPPVMNINVSQSAAPEGLWAVMAGEDVVAINSVPASTALLEEFNELGPNRSKASDGTIGDLAHSHSTSDHNPDETGNTGSASDGDFINEVHARDITSRGPWPPGWSMERCVQLILARCRNGQEKRIRYIIYDGRIWSRNGGWVQQKYNGANKHVQHAHFSFMYGSGTGQSNPENITSPYGLLAALTADRQQQEEDMALSADDKKWITSTVTTAAEAAARTAVVGVLRDASAAALGKASGDNATDRAKRNLRDYLRTVVGGPTEDDMQRATDAILAELRKEDEPPVPDAS